MVLLTSLVVLHINHSKSIGLTIYTDTKVILYWWHDNRNDATNLMMGILGRLLAHKKMSTFSTQVSIGMVDEGGEKELKAQRDTEEAITNQC